MDLDNQNDDVNWGWTKRKPAQNHIQNYIRVFVRQTFLRTFVEATCNDIQLGRLLLKLLL